MSLPINVAFYSFTQPEFKSFESRIVLPYNQEHRTACYVVAILFIILRVKDLNKVPT